MKTILNREFYKPASAVEIKDSNSSAVSYLGTSSHSGKICACGFSGKRAKPDFNYTFRDETAARAHIAQHAASVQATEARRIEWRKQRNADKCKTVLDVWNKARTKGAISAADTAICVRAELARQFPGVKFSVTSDNYSMGCAVDVRWTDGPTADQVNRVCDCYEFAGFDGMIDLKYSKRRWLSRDGKMTLAHTEGTAGSMGSCPDGIGSPHAADCVLVTDGADYVTPSRRRSYGLELALAREVAAKFGVTMPDSFADENEFQRWLNQARVTWSNGSGEYLATLMHRHETEANA